MKKVKKRPKPKDLAGEKVISSHKLQPIGITQSSAKNVERIGKSFVSTSRKTNINQSERNTNKDQCFTQREAVKGNSGQGCG